MKTLKLKHYSDAGHGWVAVKRTVLVQLSIADLISNYSYQSKTGSTVYLEEDSDANCLISKLKELNLSYQIESKNNGDLSPIRSYDRYRAVSQ